MIFQKKNVWFSAWNYLVVVVITDDINAAIKRLKLKTDDEPPAAQKNTGGICRHDRNDGQSFMFIKPKASVSVVAHESWHCVRRMLIYMGADLDSETVAYHIGYLAEKVHQFAHKEIKDGSGNQETVAQKG